MDAIASENVLTHGVPLPQDVRLFSVLRREYKRLCAALRSFDLWFCMRDGVARNVCARSAGIHVGRASHSLEKYVTAEGINAPESRWLYVGRELHYTCLLYTSDAADE